MFSPAAVFSGTSLVSATAANSGALFAGVVGASSLASIGVDGASFLSITVMVTVMVSSKPESSVTLRSYLVYAVPALSLMVQVMRHGHAASPLSEWNRHHHQCRTVAVAARSNRQELEELRVFPFQQFVL